MTGTAIIIPSVGVDDLLRRSVNECRRTAPDAEIIVVLDDGVGAEELGAAVTPIVTGPLSIAAKRNSGAETTKAEYLAFIDSDAYPDDGWPANGVRALADPAIAIVGGPDLPWPDEIGWARFIGVASKSPLISAKSAYRKYRAPARDCPHLPSCNMIVRRADYMALGGMDKGLATGEDLEYCSRVRAAGGRIRYLPKVAVFHRDRDLGPFVLQRAVYGASVWRLARRGLSASSLYLFAPSLVVAFFASSPVGVIFPAYAAVVALAAIVLAVLLLAEAVRVASRPGEIPGLVVVLGVGLVTPGVGTILGGLGLLPATKTIYRNAPTRSQH